MSAEGQSILQQPAGSVATTSSAAGGESMLGPFVMFVPLIIIFYLFFIRPESKRRKEKETMLSAVKIKDKIVTVSGMYASVAEIDGDEVVLLIDPKKDVRVRVQRSAIASVVSSGEKS